jgi:hypothetical protein
MFHMLNFDDRNQFKDFESLKMLSISTLVLEVNIQVLEPPSAMVKDLNS